MKSITSAANAAYRQWLRLAQHPRESRTQGRALAEGLHLAQAALEASVAIEAVLLRCGAASAEAARLAEGAMPPAPTATNLRRRCSTAFEVATILNDALDAARQTGSLALGAHCCGNTDWSLFLESTIDVLSFDSYGFFDSLLLYDQALRKYLERGGWLAWGLVPTGEEIHGETADSLWQRFETQVQKMADRGFTVREVLAQALLTPACGLGYLDSQTAARALALLAELSARGRQWQASLR